MKPDESTFPGYYTPVVLRAMTLHGVGPYVRPARLEIKPLTLLCGTNGAGKSTWLRVLKILRRSLDLGWLPFALDVDDSDPRNLEWMNAVHYHALPGQVPISADDEEQYGPPGSVGLELIDQVQSTRQAVRVLICHPSHASLQKATHLRRRIEIRSEKVGCFRWECPLDPSWKPPTPYKKYPSQTFPYELHYRGPLQDDSAMFDRIAALSTFNFTPTWCVDLDQPELVKLDELSRGRLDGLLKKALGGLFHLSEIRQPYKSHDAKEKKPPGPEEGDRAVGPSGEHAWTLFGRHDLDRMRELGGDTFRAESIAVPRAVDALQHRDEESERREQAAHDAASDAAKKVSETLKNISSRKVSPWRHHTFSGLLDRADPELVEGVMKLASPESRSTAEAQELVARLLNSVVADVRKHVWFSLWAESYSSNGDPSVDPGWHLAREEEEVRWISQKFFPSTEDDAEGWPQERDVPHLRRSEFVLLLSLLRRERFLIPSSQDCGFGQFVSSWLNALLGTQVGQSDVGEAILDRMVRNQLEFDAPVKVPAELVLDRLEGNAGPVKDRPIAPSFLIRADQEDFPAEPLVDHPCFTLSPGQSPERMSAGFHQVFPIVVQLALMRWGETLAIENPEVHLHPGLQLKIAHMLVEFAKSGRQILVETQSDLVVRRVLRAILAEEIPQSAVAMYFAQLQESQFAASVPDADAEPADDELPDEPAESTGESPESTDAEAAPPAASKAWGAVLEPIQINDQGRVVNWPPGFLDDDVEESKRLLDIMYGKDAPSASDDDA